MCYVIPAAAPAQTLGRLARPRITERIDESNLRTLRGNTHPLANAANDRGAVPGSFAMEHMLLQLKRTPAQNQAVEQFLDRLHDTHSAGFHRWLTPAQFGEQFGVAQQDLDTITEWLRSRGFVVNTIYPGGMAIDFSGTAAQVREAFHTGIHRLEAAGQTHIANMSDPEIPAALAPVVAGVVSMHDFKPHEMSRKGRAKFTFQSGGQTVQAITPGDLAAIYNLSPLFAGGATGKGQTIAVIEDTQLYSADDWNTFRSTFGLTQYTSGSLRNRLSGKLPRSRRQFGRQRGNSRCGMGQRGGSRCND